MHPLFSYFCKDAEGFLLSVGTQAVIAGRKEGQVDPTVGGSSKLNRRTERITNLTGEFRLTLLLQVGTLSFHKEIFPGRKHTKANGDEESGRNCLFHVFHLNNGNQAPHYLLHWRKTD